MSKFTHGAFSARNKIPGKYMPNQTGYIYKLVSNNTNKVYIGSTFLNPSRRFDAHVYYFKQYRDHGVGTRNYAHEILQHPDCRIEVLESCEVSDRDALRALERVWFDKLRPNLTNKNAPIDDNEKRRLAQKAYQAKYKAAKCCRHCGAHSSGSDLSDEDRPAKRGEVFGELGRG
jgi:hypothetical protein